MALARILPGDSVRPHQISFVGDSQKDQKHGVTVRSQRTRKERWGGVYVGEWGRAGTTSLRVSALLGVYVRQTGVRSVRVVVGVDEKKRGKHSHRRISNTDVCFDGNVQCRGAV